MRSRTWRCFGLASLFLLSGNFVAQADVVIPAAAAVPGTAQNAGLNGSVYLVGGVNSGFNYQFPNAVERVTQAIALMSTRPPDARFRAHSLNYGVTPNDSDTTPLNLFLGADGGSLTPNLANPVYTSILNMQGFLQVAPAELNLMFTLSTDDGARLLIGGQTVVDSEFVGPNTVSGVARFEQPGIYPFQLVYFNNNFFNSGTARLSLIGAHPSTNARVYLGLFSEVLPEPSTLALVGMGILGVVGYGWKGRRRGRQRR